MSILMTFLTLATDKFIEVLVEKLTGNLCEAFKSDPVKLAYKHSLGLAIKDYSQDNKISLLRPIFNKNGILMDKEVNLELSKLLQFNGDPDFVLIGNRWKNALIDPPSNIDFTQEAKKFVNFLNSKMRDNSVFRPIFESKDINMISLKQDQSIDKLDDIEDKLADLVEIVDSQLGSLLDKFIRATPKIRDNIFDFNTLIEEKTHGFVGRQWIFEAVRTFTRLNRRGYFFIKGDPGIGKSSIAAQLIKQNGYIHHFNVRAEGINKPQNFISNICAQLIVSYNLEYDILPEKLDNAGLLNKILNQVSNSLKFGDQCVIVIDALDEVASINCPTGENSLFLPKTIPDGIFFIITMRNIEEVIPFLDCEQDELYIYNDSSNNLSDIRDYLQASTLRQGIKRFLSIKGMIDKKFVDTLIQKSEGNFMYLHYILPEIEHGVYFNYDLDNLPLGLKNYYEDHWRYMRGLNKENWFNYKLPVLIALSVVFEPVSVDLLSRFSQVENRQFILEVLREWSPFLHKQEINYKGGKQQRFSLYHSSFYDFISSKQEIAEEKVNFKSMYQQMVNSLMGDLMNE